MYCGVQMQSYPFGRSTQVPPCRQVTFIQRFSVGVTGAVNAKETQNLSLKGIIFIFPTLNSIRGVEWTFSPNL